MRCFTKHATAHVNLVSVSEDEVHVSFISRPLISLPIKTAGVTL